MRRVAVAGALLLAVTACSDSSDPTTEATVLAAPTPAEMVAAGEESFLGTCAACHGQDARGIGGLGKNLVGTEFVQGQTVDELVAFLQVGRSATDPLNTTGIEMQPRGGNPNLTVGGGSSS